jgi:hypothetical protein
MNKAKGIQCPIDLFPRQEQEVIRLTQAINQACTASLKVPYAQALIEVVAVLLACESYDETSVDCNLCRQFSQLRYKTTSLIVKAGQLDESRKR